jgi:1,4-dihydroxy-2-naphthoate polyprenyltransferase
MIKKKAILWLTELRAHFLLITIFPVCLGALLSRAFTGKFSLGNFLLVMVGAVCFHLGTNVINDFVDNENGTDNINTEYLPGFSGGTRLIQNSLMNKWEVFAESAVFFAVSFLIGAYFTYKTGLFVLYLGAAGFVTVLLYSFFNNSFYIGEALVGICYGWLVTAGSYYVLSGDIRPAVFLISFPLVILTFLILWINEFPDYKADRQSGKLTLVVRIGRKAASRVYFFSLILLYSCILYIGIRYRAPLLLLAVLTLPLSIASVRSLYQNYDEPARLLGPAVSTVKLYAALGAVLLVGFLFRHP